MATTHIPTIFRFFFSLSSFSSSPTSCCLRLPLPVFSGVACLYLCPLVLILKVSCSLVLVLPIPVCLPGGPCVAFWICLGSGSPGHEVALWYHPSLWLHVMWVVLISTVVSPLWPSGLQVSWWLVLWDKWLHVVGGYQGLLLGWGGGIIVPVSYNICSQSPNIIYF